MLWTLALLLACGNPAGSNCNSDTGDTGATRPDLDGGAAVEGDGGGSDGGGAADDTGTEATAEVTLWLDADGDGYGSDGTVGLEVTITGPEDVLWAVVDTSRQWTALGGDCDDSRPEINPNPLDSDCD